MQHRPPPVTYAGDNLELRDPFRSVVAHIDLCTTFERLIFRSLLSTFAFRWRTNSRLFAL